MSDLIFPLINLLILIAIMVVYLREPLKGFVLNRHETLRDELQRVRDLLVQSQSKYDEFTHKLKSMEAEIVTLREQARQDAAASHTRITTEAKHLSTTIVSDARVSAQGLYAALKHELLAELGNKIMDRSEAILKERLTGDDRARIRNEFSAQVESVQ
jgi:F-type H+-transporting ATPase subunit b